MHCVEVKHMKECQGSLIKENVLDEPVKLSCTINPDSIELTLPLLTVSEANGGRKKSVIRNGKKVYRTEHWTDKHKRHKQQKKSVHLLLKQHQSLLKTPCTIHLTRYAPSTLDKHDNLPMSLKWILDACCELVTGDYRPGRADNNQEISVFYDQIKCKSYGVRIKISF